VCVFAYAAAASCAQPPLSARGGRKNKQENDVHLRQLAKKKYARALLFLIVF
jgi:hypothetical protein